MQIKSPQILEEQIKNGKIFQRCIVPDGLVYLEGHFPEIPIVPGVVQIDWVMQALKRVLNRDREKLQMEAMKFTNILQPGVEFFIEVKPMKIPEKYQFRLWSDQSEFSKGRIFLAQS